MSVVHMTFSMPSYEQIVQRNYGVYSTEQQKAIRSARVAIVGVGCDGGLVALILARVGIGHLTLMDFDTIEASNLNRQPLCTVSSLGRKKVEVAREMLLDCNPNIKIAVHDRRITTDSIDALRGHDVILQCVDNFASRVAVHRLGKALAVAVVSMTGQPPYRAFVSTFLPDGPDYEDAMGLPSTGKSLDREMEYRLNNLKFQRAQNAAAYGATPGWCEDYMGGKSGWGDEPVGWGITPERSYITATIQAHEALRIVTGRPILAAAPKAIVIDLLDSPNLVLVREPPDGKRWDYRQF
jgi:molybdopterin/thiamine biosynthesis adenylyltransferase